jgi:hypothetical protein
MYIIVESYTKQEYNPYYSPTNSYRESEFYSAQSERLFYCHSDEALATWITKNPKATYKAYRAQPITVTTNTTVNIAIS